ncbi:uncharacterized protein LOC131629835 [Vicia villosa]|uniref:uncharacterized protein LOC131629835 n=1 Tax=Vicia villosa TaxID=3911 RepID=UPI00273A868E|nr:uncharacterized protein LOC131629835 [Vicia villosa]
MSIPPNFCGFKKLLELHLVCVTFDSVALGSFMSGSPFLEKLCIEYCDGFEYLDISSPTLKVLLLEIIHDVKSICLKNAKNLIDFTLDANHNSLSDLIKSLPKIKRFSLFIWKKSYNYDDTTQVLGPSKELECLSCCCLKLQTVNIYVDASAQHAMSLIKFILANSPLLKTLTFNIFEESEAVNAVMFFEISQDLLLMERASPRARVKFKHSPYPLFW